MGKTDINHFCSGNLQVRLLQWFLHETIFEDSLAIDAVTKCSRQTDRWGQKVETYIVSYEPSSIDSQYIFQVASFNTFSHI